MYISIIIPTYNRAEFIGKTIQSVLDQTYKKFELLICDDGSTDNTKELVESFQDERIRWIPGENSGGPATPRNRGVKSAKYDWVAFLDSDDLWVENKLERQVDHIEKSRLNFVSTNARILKGDSFSEGSYLELNGDLKYSYKDLLNCNFVITSSVLAKKKLLLDCELFPEEQEFRAVEDYVLWLAAATYGDVYIIDEPLCIYRDEPEQSIRSDFKSTKYSEFFRYTKILKKSFGKSMKKRISISVFISFLAYFFKRLISLLR